MQVTLLKYFKSYMTEHLLKAGGTAGERPIEEGVRLPHLRAWFRTRSAIILHLSNGILQVCTKFVHCKSTLIQHFLEVTLPGGLSLLVSSYDYSLDMQ